MKSAVKRHLEFYNCAHHSKPVHHRHFLRNGRAKCQCGTGEYDPSSITSVKAALMGPLAGIGDSFFWGTFRVIGAGIVARWL